MPYLSDKYLTRSIDYSRAPVNPSALIVIRYNSGFTLAYDDGKPDLCGIRENAPETARQAWVDRAKAERMTVLTMNAPSVRKAEPACDIGADGKPQYRLNGLETGAGKSLAQRRADSPLMGKRAQQACNHGLFSDEADQLDLCEMFQDPAEDE